MVNTFPDFPTRCCRKNSGPRLPRRFASGDGGDHDQQHRQAHDCEGDVDEPLQPAVAVTMDLADVEHERDALELPEGDLAEPLLIEERHRAHARTPLVEERRLRHDVLVSLRLAVEHDQGRSSFRCSRDQRRATSGRASLRAGEDLRELSGALRTASELFSQELALVETPDEHESLPILGSGSRVASEGGAEHEPGHQQHRGAEHHEPGQQHAVREELSDRDADRGRRACAEAGDPGRPPAAEQLGQADRVRRHGEQRDVRKRPEEAGRTRVVVDVPYSVQLAEPEDRHEDPRVLERAREPGHGHLSTIGRPLCAMSRTTCSRSVVADDDGGRQCQAVSIRPRNWPV